MVGRAAELDRLAQLFPPGADPELVLVAGEAGVGKTRLVQEALATVPFGTAVLTGRAQEGGMGRPFELLLEAVEPLVRDWTEIPEALQPRAEPIRLLLAPAVPAFACRPDRDYGPEELLRAGIDLVRHLVGVGPAVLLFEDLHWADAESVTLFGRLATTPDLRLLLLGTYRPEDLGRRDPLAQVLVGLDRQRRMVQVTVDRLDRTGVRDLLAAVFDCPIPWSVVDAMYQRTGGNPFFLEELLVTACCAEPDTLATLPLPWNLTEAVLRHLDGLPDDALRVVDAASVLGQRIPFDLLAAVTGTGEDDLIAALRTLVAGNLLVEEEPDVFSFRHALTREAVESQLLGRERRRLHEKALAALVETGTSDYAALAHHAHAAARFDEAVDYARRGAVHFLRMGSSWQALRLVELALTEAPDDLELLGLARLAAWMIGLYDVAIAHAERALDLAVRQGRPEVEAKMLAHLARIKWDLGDLEGHWETIERALALAESLPPSQELAATQALVAEAYMLLGRSAEAIDWADRSLALAAELDRPFLRPRALVAKGTAMQHDRAQRVEGLAVLDEAVREAEKYNNGAALARALYNGLDHTCADRPPAEAWRLIGRIREVAERSGFDKMAGSATAVIAVQAAAVDGDRATAERYLDEANRRNHSPDQGMEATHAARWEVLLALEAGDLPAARAQLGRCQPSPRAQCLELIDYEQLVAGIGSQAGDVEAVRTSLKTYAAVDSDREFWGEATADIVASALRAGVPVAEVRAAVAP